MTRAAAEAESALAPAVPRATHAEAPAVFGSAVSLLITDGVDTVPAGLTLGDRVAAWLTTALFDPRGEAVAPSVADRRTAAPAPQPADVMSAIRTAAAGASSGGASALLALLAGLFLLAAPVPGRWLRLAREPVRPSPYVLLLERPG